MARYTITSGEYRMLHHDTINIVLY